MPALRIRPGAMVIQQSKQVFPGKGLAMKEGLKEAITKSDLADDQDNGLIVFLDAANLTRNRLANWLKQ